MKKIGAQILGAHILIVCTLIVCSHISYAQQAQTPTSTQPTHRQDGFNNIFDFTNTAPTTGYLIGDGTGDRKYTIKNDANYPVYVRIGYKEPSSQCYGTGLMLPAHFPTVTVQLSDCTSNIVSGYIFKEPNKGIDLIRPTPNSGKVLTWHVVEEGNTAAIKLSQ